MTRVVPISVAVENRSASLITGIRSAIAEYVDEVQCVSIEIVPSEPLEGDIMIGETEQIAMEALRRAEIIREAHGASLGVSFVSGHISTRTTIRNLRRSYETVAIVAAAKEGAVGLGFPINTVPEDLIDSLDAEMAKVGDKMQRGMTKAPDQRICQVGKFVVNALASFSYAAEGETWHGVH